MRKVKVSKEEENYIVRELTKRSIELATWEGVVRESLRLLGGISFLLTRRSDDKVVFDYEVSICVGDIMQLLQRYRNKRSTDASN